MSGALPVRAAQYLRMSTEHQRYSLANQADVIAAYAEAHGYTLTRSYFDPGVSGLTFKERRGLQALLTEALAPAPDFEAILVLDVSRWGRFQDLDQSAHYEFLCRQAGVPVVYCAEPFRNDGSAEANILKMLKRMMAAEYSRELSVKVTRAKLHNARLGRHCGGPAPYGFRRLLVDAHGRPRMVLPPGSRRSFEGEHVVLTHGPRDELATIRRIFRMYVEERRGPKAIARHLNHTGVTSGRHPKWSTDIVRSILGNELVVGVQVFNRTTRVLKTRSRVNPLEDQIRLRLLKPIVSHRLFEAAQRLRGRREVRHIDRAEMLKAMRNLLHEKGKLSAHIIDDCPHTPCAASYARYFGNLAAAYEAIGYIQRSTWGPLRGRATLDDDQMLDLLKSAYKRLGTLSVAQINADPQLPSDHYFRARFGSLAAAFARAGLPRGGPRRTQSVRLRPAPSLMVQAGQPERRPSSSLSNADLLEVLRTLHTRDGYVSGATLRREAGAPCVSLFQSRFGSLTAAYMLAGLPGLRERLRRAALDRRGRFGVHQTGD